MTQDEVEKFILSQPGVRRGCPFGEAWPAFGVLVSSGELVKDPAKFQSENPGAAPDEKWFAALKNGSDPLNLNLRVDPNLGKLLREKYESVQPARKLNRRHWITILLTGQMSDDDLRDLIRHSYHLASE
ncbi:MAG: MmcQ/YjbR family DNA-binding protein [Candidatus Nomurabacteria bacterium]|jgi:predicted DNA-binding protein (MmcQ/YjbR family)|nr:MmcQ/YjbR family DNA-binding protein [Candidatus Nomurabacteria bacterium]